jgi:signal transduction histidine kinase
MKISKKILVVYLILFVEHVFVLGIFFFTLRYTHDAFNKNTDIYTIINNVSDLVVLIDALNDHNRNEIVNQWDVKTSWIKKDIYNLGFENEKIRAIAATIIGDIQKTDQILKNFLKDQLDEYGGKAEKQSIINNIVVILRDVSASCDILLERSLLQIKQVGDWCEYSILMVLVFFMCSLVWAFWFIAKSILVPIKSLSAKTEQIGRGNFDLSLDVVSEDEIGDFARSFIDMAHKLRLMTVSRDKLADEVEARRKVEKTLKQNEAALKALSSKILSVMEEERKRIGMELHDGVVQDLIALKLQQENAIRMMRRNTPEVDLGMFEKNLAYIQRVIILLREIIMGLRPAILDDLGLVPALQWYCREFAKTYDMFEFHIRIAPLEVSVPNQVGTALFRVVQEALQNVVKHSGTSRITISLECSGEMLEARIEDNGKGFDPVREDFKLKGMGMSGMRERTESVNGLFFVKAVPGQGVSITAMFPFEECPNAQRHG